MGIRPSLRILTHLFPPDMYHRLPTTRLCAQYCQHKDNNPKVLYLSIFQTLLVGFGFIPQYANFHFPMNPAATFFLLSHRMFLQNLPQSNCVLTSPSSLQRACFLLTYLALKGLFYLQVYFHNYLTWVSIGLLHKD